MSEDENIGQCGCGSAWFYLMPLEEGDDELPAAVCIDDEGSITGYAGQLYCIECDEPWDPNIKFKPRGHLRVVQ